MNVSYAEALKRGWVTKEEAQASKGPKKGAATRKHNKDAEGSEQAELIAAFGALYPAQESLLIHIPNGGYRKNKFEGWRLKQQGVRAGVSDLFLPIARGGFFGLWLEFKAAPPFSAAVSDAQLAWLAAMREQGYRAELCKGVESTLAVLTDYMSQPPTRGL